MTTLVDSRFKEGGGGLARTDQLADPAGRTSLLRENIPVYIGGNMRPRSVPIVELVRDRPRGRVTGFRCRPSRLAEAFARVPDEAILEAYAFAWAPARPPDRTIGELRAAVLAIHRRAVERTTMTGPAGVRPVAIADAAAELGLSPRGLRDAAARGEYESTFIGGRSGARRTLAVLLPEPEPVREFRLIPSRLQPDARERLRGG